jgi:hypothetical protein
MSAAIKLCAARSILWWSFTTALLYALSARLE